MPDDNHSDDTPFSSEADSINDATPAKAFEDASVVSADPKPAGALKFLTVIMLLLAVGLIAGPFIWGLEDLKTIKPDSSVLNDWLEWLGDLHLVILHIPIGIFVLVFTMEIFGLLSFRKFKPHLGGALALNSVFAIIAVVFGYLLFLQGDQGNAPLTWDWENNLMGMHMWLSIAFAVFVILSFLSKMWSRHHDRFSPFYPVFMLLAAASMTIGAHMGGEMVHKDKDIVGDFLVLANGGTLGIAQEDIEKVRDVTDIPPEDRLVYAEIVKPILQGKCWECHAVAELNPLGKTKIKGGLEMTSVELLLKGGKNADATPTLVPGDVNLSEMLIRVHLNVDDEDFMPKGKEDKPEAHLTEGETRILEWWIANGTIEAGVIDEADDVPLKEVEGYEVILSDVAAFEPVLLPEIEVEKKEEKTEAEIPVEKEEVAPEITRVELTELKKEIDAQFPSALTFASATSDEMYFTAATFGPEFNDTSLQALEPVAAALVELDLKRTSISDEGMATVTKFTNLRKLTLNETAISDGGVKAIAELPALESLSLFDTQISDEGVLALRNVATLQNIYLSRTGASQEAVNVLKAALPEANVVYQPTLVEPVIPPKEQADDNASLVLPDAKIESDLETPTEREPTPTEPVLPIPEAPLPDKPAIDAPAPARDQNADPVVPPKPDQAQLEKKPLEEIPLEEEAAQPAIEAAPQKVTEELAEPATEDVEEKEASEPKLDPEKKEITPPAPPAKVEEKAPAQKPAPLQDSPEKEESQEEGKAPVEEAEQQEAPTQEEAVSQRAREAIEKLRKAAEGE